VARIGGGLADHSIISRLLVKVRKARAQAIGDYTTHSLGSGSRRLREGGTALCALISISGALEACIVEWQM
jgi:hypothetical protein